MSLIQIRDILRKAMCYSLPKHHFSEQKMSSSNRRRMNLFSAKKIQFVPILGLTTANRVARWLVYYQTQNIESFWGPCNGRCWYILWTFGLIYGQLVYFMDIWYIFTHFGIFTKKESGNPDYEEKKMQVTVPICFDWISSQGLVFAFVNFRCGRRNIINENLPC
jgi:hypothetical protein